MLGLCLSHTDKIENGEVHHRRKATHSGQVTEEKEVGARQQEVISPSACSWRRIVLLILAITIHNIPGKATVCLLICLPSYFFVSVLFISFKSNLIEIKC